MKGWHAMRMKGAMGRSLGVFRHVDQAVAAAENDRGNKCRRMTRDQYGLHWGNYFIFQDIAAEVLDPPRNRHVTDGPEVYDRAGNFKSKLWETNPYREMRVFVCLRGELYLGVAKTLAAAKRLIGRTWRSDRGDKRTSFAYDRPDAYTWKLNGAWDYTIKEVALLE